MGVTRALPQSRPLTYDDLQAMPDDGHRYELVDGVLIVTPAPRTLHQRAVRRLTVLLDGAAPEHLEVFIAPFDFVASPDTVLEPDLLVARRADLTDRNLPTPPVLVIEVLSPSTRRIDLGTKRLAFQDAGVPSYWLVDPDDPSLTVLELVAGEYHEVARVTGDQRFDAVRPFAVSVTPAELVR
jgi:Uma2 family endonuclease